MTKKKRTPAQKLAREIQAETGKPYTECLAEAQVRLGAEADSGREVAELRWHYGPTDWAPDPGRMWHYDCPGGRGEVMYDGDGWAFCMGCKAVQAPEGEGGRPHEPLG